MVYLIQGIFYGIPVAAVLFFAISLYRYCRARSMNRKTPGSIPAGEMKKRKILFIISSVIAAVLASVVGGFMLLLFLAVAFM